MGTPFQRTCAPFTKWLPVTVRVNGPGGKGFGATAVTLGTRLLTVTLHEAEAEGSALLVALTVTLQPLGGTAGATYLPVLSIVPTVELPAGTPLTVHLTVVSAAPFTFAVICLTPPTATVKLVGSTVTVTPAGAAAKADSEQATRINHSERNVRERDI